MKEKVEYFEHIKGSGEPEYIPQGSKFFWWIIPDNKLEFGWENQHSYGESVNQESHPENRRTDYASDISYETTYGNYKEKELAHKESEKTIVTPQGSQPVNRRTDYAQDISYETTYGKYKEKELASKEYEKTTITHNINQSDNKRTDYAQDISYETTYGKHKEPAKKEPKESEKVITHQTSQELKTSVALESSSLQKSGSSMQKSGSTTSSSYQPPTIKISRASDAHLESHTSASPGPKPMKVKMSINFA